MQTITRSILCILILVSPGIFSHREKRFVIYPLGGRFKVVLGIGIPLKLGIKQSMSIGWNLQMQYDVPTNITMLQQYPPFYDRKFREKRAIEETDRSLFYKAFEDVLNGAGIDGRDCILRSICENAVESLHHEANGLYGLIFHIVFTPNYGNEAGDSNMDPSYMEAQRAGEYGVECQTLYSQCTLDDGLIGLFSILDYELG